MVELSWNGPAGCGVRHAFLACHRPSRPRGLPVPGATDNRSRDRSCNAPGAASPPCEPPPRSSGMPPCALWALSCSPCGARRVTRARTRLLTARWDSLWYSGSRISGTATRSASRTATSTRTWRSSRCCPGWSAPVSAVTPLSSADAGLLVEHARLARRGLGDLRRRGSCVRQKKRREARPWKGGGGRRVGGLGLRRTAVGRAAGRDRAVDGVQRSPCSRRSPPGRCTRS